MKPSTLPTMKTQHTATPWHQTANMILAGDNTLIATIADNTSIRSQDEYCANAEFICRAVNSHEALVAGISAAMRALEYPADIEQAHSLLAHAIAQAEGRSS